MSGRVGEGPRVGVTDSLAPGEGDTDADADADGESGGDSAEQPVSATKANPTARAA
jgi:hypothetical protein